MYRRTYLAWLGAISTTGCLSLGESSGTPESCDHPTPMGNVADDVVVRNRRGGPSEVTVTVVDLHADCTAASETLDLGDGVDGSVPDPVIMEVPYRISVDVTDGPSDSYRWPVGERSPGEAVNDDWSLEATVRADAVAFELIGPGGTPVDA